MAADVIIEFKHDFYYFLENMNMDDNGNTAGKGLHAVVFLALVVVDILLGQILYGANLS